MKDNKIDILLGDKFMIKIGFINQVANPLQQGNIVEVHHTYKDETVVGDQVTVVKVIKSSGQSVEIGETRLVASYKITVLENWSDVIPLIDSKTLISALIERDNIISNGVIEINSDDRLLIYKY